MRPGNHAGAFAVALAGVFTVSQANANGRFPASNQLVVAPSDPKTLVLRTTFGLLVSRNAGASWSWICESAVGYGGGAEDPAIGITASSAILAATQEGLAVSSDTGCGWTFASTDKPVADVVVRRSASGSALAVSWDPLLGFVDGGAAPRVFQTIDNGATWTPLGVPLDPQIEPETVDVAATDPRRVYVGGRHLVQRIPQGALLVSMDDGQTWTEHVVAIDPANELDVFIAAVDPMNADRVYLRILNVYGGRLIVTDDGGKTSRTVLTTAVPMPGFALSPDGSRVYVGGAGGILMAHSSDLQFAKESSVPVQCLTATQSVLYACSSETTGGFSLGASTDDGATFKPLLHFSDIRGPLTCNADSSAAHCADEWPVFVGVTNADGATPVLDSGAMDAT
ncbi:MAG: hypothetical protein M3O46_16630, partial [Myxococcota bacterium]|nr:hypothetical protein [Myxococcota bacterium]